MQHGQRHRFHAIGKNRYGISSFQGTHNGTLGTHRFEGSPRHGMKEPGGEFTASQQISHGGIQTTTDNEQVWIVVGQQRQDELVKGRRIFGIAHARLTPTNVQIQAFGCTRSNLIRRTRVGIEPNSVKINPKDIVVTNRGFASAVA